MVAKCGRTCLPPTDSEEKFTWTMPPALWTSHTPQEEEPSPLHPLITSVTPSGDDGEALLHRCWVRLLGGFCVPREGYQARQLGHQHERAFEKQLHGESCELTSSLPSLRLTGKAREAHSDEARLTFG